MMNLAPAYFSTSSNTTASFVTFQLFSSSVFTKSFSWKCYATSHWLCEAVNCVPFISDEVFVLRPSVSSPAVDLSYFLVLVADEEKNKSTTELRPVYFDVQATTPVVS